METIIKAIEDAIKSAEWNVNHYNEKIKDYTKYKEEAELKLAQIKEEYETAKSKLGIVEVA